MAKFDAGDERWIVKDLGDQGQNVNNWHWREYDALEWSRDRLKAAFLDTDLLDSTPGSSLKITDVTCSGEAIVNNRKNKLIPAYELEITLKWAGQLTDGEGKSAGSSQGRIVLPYVSDENHDEVPEVRFSSEADDAPTQRLREAFHSQGKAVSVCRPHGCSHACQ
jgi:activator of HSP90 ATPase